MSQEGPRLTSLRTRLEWYDIVTEVSMPVFYNSFIKPIIFHKKAGKPITVNIFVSAVNYMPK